MALSEVQFYMKYIQHRSQRISRSLDFSFNYILFTQRPNFYGITVCFPLQYQWLSNSFLMLRVLFLCFRKKLGRGRQHEGGGRQDAEGVREPERLDQRGAAVSWEQSVYHPLLTAWGNMIAFCLVIVIVHKIILNYFTILPLKYDKQCAL